MLLFWASAAAASNFSELSTQQRIPWAECTCFNSSQAESWGCLQLQQVKRPGSGDKVEIRKSRKKSRTPKHTKRASETLKELAWKSRKCCQTSLWSTQHTWLYGVGTIIPHAGLPVSLFTLGLDPRALLVVNLAGPGDAGGPERLVPRVVLLLLLVLRVATALLFGALKHLVLDKLGQVGEDKLLLATTTREKISRALPFRWN